MSNESVARLHRMSRKSNTCLRRRHKPRLLKTSPQGTVLVHGIAAILIQLLLSWRLTFMQTVALLTTRRVYIRSGRTIRRATMAMMAML
eukprot:2222696-Pleurochrysis_carterae.AAC.2